MLWQRRFQVLELAQLFYYTEPPQTWGRLHQASGAFLSSSSPCLSTRIQELMDVWSHQSERQQDDVGDFVGHFWSTASPQSIGGMSGSMEFLKNVNKSPFTSYAAPEKAEFLLVNSSTSGPMRRLDSTCMGHRPVSSSTSKGFNFLINNGRNITELWRFLPQWSSHTPMME